ncbi:MAG: hypothetical protein ACE5E0_00905, partial [Terriglobia bacterium]
MAEVGLFSPGKIGRATVRNRLMMSLFPAGLARDSFVTDAMSAFYRARAGGGVGLIVVENPPLNYPFDHKGGHQFRIDDSRFHDRARKFCDELRADGARVFVQLAY